MENRVRQSVFVGASIRRVEHMTFWERVFGVRSVERRECLEDGWVHLPNDDDDLEKKKRYAFYVWSQLWKDEGIIMY